MQRKLTYAQAINETLHQLMQKDRNIIVIGQGVTSPWYVGTTTSGLLDKFGESRIIDSPVSENAITGVAGGTSLVGLRPILVHPRMDFMYYAFDQIINHIANWHFMFGGKVNMPVVFWAIVNRGGEQAAQHSQALQGLFMHVPGLKIVMPSNPYDAKGLLVAAVNDSSPVLYIDDRWLYNQKGDVPQKLYSSPIGKAQIRRRGKNITIVASSYMTVLALKVAEHLKTKSIEVEVIDLRSLKPFDEVTVIRSVKKTGRLLVLDGGFRTCGVASEVSARISEKVFSFLKAPVERITLPDTPAPASQALEEAYYPTEKTIIQAAKKLYNTKDQRLKTKDRRPMRA